MRLHFHLWGVERKRDSLQEFEQKLFSGSVHYCLKQVNSCCWPRRAWRPSTFSPWCSSPPSLQPEEKQTCPSLPAVLLCTGLMDLPQDSCALVGHVSEFSVEGWVSLQLSSLAHSVALGGHVTCCTQLSATVKDRPPLVHTTQQELHSRWGRIQYQHHRSKQTPTADTCSLKCNLTHLTWEQGILFKLR